MRPRRFTLDQYADALRQAGGSRSQAAALLGCRRTTVDSIVRSHAELKALCTPYPRPTGPDPRYRPEQVADALRQAGGNQRQAARLLGCCELTVRIYMRLYPEVKAACAPRLKSPEQIVEALRQAGGHRGRAAQLLGVERSTLVRYIRRYEVVQEVCVTLDQARREEPAPVSRSYANAQRYSPGKVAEALRLAAGIKADAARRLGCARSTVNAYIKRYPEVQEAWIDARETVVDLAQSKLQAAVERGEWEAVRYTLSTLGKDRGFSARPTPQPVESAVAAAERRRAEFLADIRRVYGEADEEEDVEDDEEE